MTDTANLEDGFYWVRVNGDWEPAQCIDDEWFVTGDAQIFNFDAFDEIDPRPIKREDVK